MVSNRPQLLINKANVRRFALGACEAHYKVDAYRPTRISKDFFDDLDAFIRMHITEVIAHRPSKGKTL